MHAERDASSAGDMSPEELRKFSALLDSYVLYREGQNELLHRRIAIVLMSWFGIIVALLGVRVYLYGKVFFAVLLLLGGAFLCFAAVINVKPTEETKKIISPLHGFIKEEETYGMIDLLLFFGLVLLPFSSLLLIVLFYGCF